MANDTSQAPTTIEHAGLLEDLTETPAYLLPDHESGRPQTGTISCSYCGVGDSGIFRGAGQGAPAPPTPGEGTIEVRLKGEKVQLPAQVDESGEVKVRTTVSLTPARGILTGTLTVGDVTSSFMGREVATVEDSGAVTEQRFEPYSPRVKVTQFKVDQPKPTTGCVKLRISTMRQSSAYPIHTAPSILDPETGERRAISYEEAIARFAELMLKHRGDGARSLIYASGQIDYFAIFAVQEVFRLLGVRNLTGNAEHCLNAGAVHNEVLTGQEGPFLTIAQALDGPNRVYLMNGWNGMISHPPVYRELTKRANLDGYLVEVMVTETAKGMAQKMGVDRILLIRPRSDAHLALAVAHEILDRHPDAVEPRFIERFADQESFERFKELASSEQFVPARVAERIAPESQYKERLLKGIRMLAIKLADPETVPIAIPSVGLSQSSGIVAHCLWGNVLGMLGKYGLKPDGTPAGGVLRVPGQINAESEVQALSRKFFPGRIPMDRAPEAARRMGLPDDAYQGAVDDMPRAALDYSEPTPGDRELFICLGTQFEANMPNRRRWLDKLTDPANSLVVIDPIPDPWSEKHAELIIPSPPHPAVTKLYQNGEWKLSLSVPQKRAAAETRSDATILYDMMAEITQRLEAGEASNHPDLQPHLESGYLHHRFCAPADGQEGLTRIDGEVSRVELWDRIQSYFRGGSGPLYCSFDHTDGTPIEWGELVEQGSLIYGGVGENRYVLDYDDPEAVPFRDIFRQPGAFKFFYPTEEDLALPEGILFNSGRSSLSDDRGRIHFATSTFNSGKATPVVKIPDEHPLYVSPYLAERTGLETGDRAKVTGSVSGASVELPVVVSDRVKGETVYVSFHRSKAQERRGLYINDVTDHLGRCPYSGQVQLKIPRVTLERVSAAVAEAVPEKVPEVVKDRREDRSSETPASPAIATAIPRIDMTVLDTAKKIPLWNGEESPLFVTDIFQETHDVYTFRFQGSPLVRFAFKPGQFSSVVLDIDGKRVVRSYSISSPPTRPYLLELTIKRVPGGLVSNWMPDNLKIGDQVRLKGPKGKFCLEPGKIPKKILFVSAGSGVTPIMSMSRWLCDISADVDIKFYCSVRSSQDIVFGKEIEMMTERYRLFTPCVISTTRGQNEPWTGLTGRVNPQMVQMVAPDLHERQVYMCGPEGFMEAVREILHGLDFDFDNLHAESFGGIRTASASKPKLASESAAMTVQFAQAGKTVAADGSQTLLEVAEDHDVDIDYGCRSGSCQDCKVRLLSGDVDGGRDGLSADEIEAGFVMSCVATPTANCVIDA